MLSCSVWFSAPSFWMGGSLESRCVGHVYGADGAVHGTIRTVHMTHAAWTSPLSTCAPDGHLQSVMIPDAV